MAPRMMTMSYRAMGSPWKARTRTSFLPPLQGVAPPQAAAHERRMTPNNFRPRRSVLYVPASNERAGQDGVARLRQRDPRPGGRGRAIGEGRGGREAGVLPERQAAARSGDR